MTRPADAHVSRRTAFVLGLDENGYGTLRSLAEAKIPTVGVWDNSTQNGRFSKYGTVLGLDASLPETTLCEALIESKSACIEKPVIFVSSDRYALLLSRHRDLLQPHFAYHWVPQETISCVVDKARMSDVCQQAGVLIPNTHITQPRENLATSIRDFPFPCLIKPVRSFRVNFPSGKNFLAHSPKPMLDFYDSHPELLGSTIWQEVIEGDDDHVFQCTTLIRENGEVGPLFQIRKIHQYPPGFGNMCYGRSEENQAVADHALNLLRFLGYRGFASLEFKRRSTDGRLYFIEMNPRLPWYNSLFKQASVNLALFGYLDLTQSDEIENVNKRQKNNVYWIHSIKDLGWFRRTRRKRRIRPFLYVFGAAKARSFAWWSWKDPVPFLHSTKHLVREAFGRVSRSLWDNVHPLDSPRPAPPRVA